jgi:hypothetical protein
MQLITLFSNSFFTMCVIYASNYLNDELVVMWMELGIF